MTIAVDPQTVLRAVLKLFDALGPDGEVAGDVDRVQISFPCVYGSGTEILILYERPMRHGRPVVSKSAAAQTQCPFSPDPDL